MYKLIEIETDNKNDLTGVNKYTVELIQFNANQSNTIMCKVFFNITDNQLTLLTTFRGSFKTVKKLLNNCINKEVSGNITRITEY